MLRARGVGAQHYLLGNLAADTTYELRLLVDGNEVARASFRTPPASLPGDGISFVVGSCVYAFSTQSHQLKDFHADDYKRYASPAGVLFELLVGDNVYLDVPLAKRFGSTPMDETVGRYLHYWMGNAAVPPVLGRFLGARPSFTTWDDHEFWNNYPEHQAHLWRTSDFRRNAWANAALACLDFFQASLNPPGIHRSRSYTFKLGGLDFFVLDTRSTRSFLRPANGKPPSLVSPQVLGRFRAWCDALEGPGILVVGQPLFTEEGNGFDATPANFFDFDPIWRAIADAPYDVMIVTGDVHHSRVLEIELPRAGRATARMAYEVIASPLCHIPGKKRTFFELVEHWLGADEPQYLPPARSEPEAVLRAKLGGLGTVAFKRYLTGTDAPLSAAMVNVRPRTSSSVEVAVAFLDLMTRGLARKSNLKVDRGDPRPPSFPNCHVNFTLR